MQNIKDLEALLRSDVGIITIETQEEARVLGLFDRIRYNVPVPLFRWTVTEGLQRLDKDMPAQMHNRKPLELLTQIKSTSTPGIYLLLDFHPFLDDPVHVRLLKDIVGNRDTNHTVVLIAHGLQIPAELKPFTMNFELSLPKREQLEQIVREEANNWSRQNRDVRITVDRNILDRFVDSLTGLPAEDVRKLVCAAIRDDGVLTETDVGNIMKAKFELLNQGGILSFEYDTAEFADIGGLEKLKHWLSLRKDSFTGSDRPAGLDPPRGIMLLGVQGCGKSLAAKSVAGTWHVPLLRLDFGTLYNKYYGESEKNLRQSLKTAEVMTPCVLWIDEIEKGISVGDNDGGTSRRILGTLLTWMAENRTRVFLVATANDIQSLPPELIRKGRMDEIFFVDLPDKPTREIIFRIHLEKRKQPVDNFNLSQLADAGEGFSGSEIEQAVVSALYLAYSKNESLDDAHILKELEQTRPLSIVMAERIASLRHWAKDRTVQAN